MKRWGVLLLAMVTLAACDTASGSLYGGGGGGGGGDDNGSGPPWHVTYGVYADHTGSPPTDSVDYADGATVTVKDQGTLNWDPYPFAGWTTVRPTFNGTGDNGGTHYNPGETFEIHSNVKLWAAWNNP